MKWWEILLASRAKLRARFCAHGMHMHRWWFWRDNAQFMVRDGAMPRTIGMGPGWVSACIVCRESWMFDPNTPRPKWWQKFRRHGRNG